MSWPSTGPEVGEAQLLEQHPAVERGLDGVLHLLEPAVGLVADQRDRRQELAEPLVPVVVSGGHPRLVEVVPHPADPRADRHLVVVEDDQELLAQAGGRVVQALEDDPRGERPVADHGDGVPFLVAGQHVAGAEAQGGRGRAAGMAGHEQVEGALGGVGIPHQAALGPDRVQAVGPAGDQLVGIDLVAGVPDQAVGPEVERQVQGQAELDDAEVAGEVRGSMVDDADQLVAHLGGEVFEVLLGERLQVARRLDPSQHRAVHQRSLSSRSRASALKPCPAFREGRQCRQGLVGEPSGVPPAPFEAEQAGVGPLPQAVILVHPLAQLRLVPLDVEQVVDDLERQAHGMTIRIEGPEGDFIGPRDDPAHLQGGPQQGPGLPPVDRLEFVEVGVEPPLGLEVGHLPADHPGRSRPFGQGQHAAGGDRLGEVAGRGSRRPGSAGRRRRGRRWPRRTPCGRSAGPGGGRRRPCSAGRRGSGNRCGPSPARRRRARPPRRGRRRLRPPSGRGSAGAACRRRAGCTASPRAAGAGRRATRPRRLPGPTGRRTGPPRPDAWPRSWTRRGRFRRPRSAWLSSWGECERQRIGPVRRGGTARHPCEAYSSPPERGPPTGSPIVDIRDPKSIRQTSGNRGGFHVPNGPRRRATLEKWVEFAAGRSSHDRPAPSSRAGRRSFVLAGPEVGEAGSEPGLQAGCGGGRRARSA